MGGPQTCSTCEHRDVRAGALRITQGHERTHHFAPAAPAFPRPSLAGGRGGGVWQGPGSGQLRALSGAQRGSGGLFRGYHIQRPPRGFLC